ncbi:hypothetical protein KFK09_002493 [Dendrobium nobile]|uniref:Ubiquitin-like protease family profile domain-containing protein n=1 Tax=Dendrobium nobile TaxID=94219 RepID=A0A8T3C6K0_DENNO|nr:hypothetical protein KFK09_002493 [Dendrobium nobile]
MWNIQKQSFIIEGHVLPFTAEEVTLLTGLPNKGLIPRAHINSLLEIFVDIQGVTPEEANLLGIKIYPSRPHSPIRFNTPEHDLPPNLPSNPNPNLPSNPNPNLPTNPNQLDTCKNLFQELEARLSKNFDQIVKRVDLIDNKLQNYIIQGNLNADQQATPSSSSFIPHIMKNIRISHTKINAPEKINDVVMTKAADQEMTQAAERHYKLKDESLKLFIEHIASLYGDCKKAFDENINKWRFKTIKKTPTQSNNTDCGIFVCKYMENIIQLNKSKWRDSKDWQEKMPKYRVEFSYALFCTALK